MNLIQFFDFADTPPSVMINVLIRLAFEKPESITPETGKAWERFVARGDKVEADAQAHIIGLYESILQMDTGQLYFLWLGVEILPRWATRETFKTKRLIDGLVDGSLSNHVQLSKFWVENDMREEFELTVKKAGVILEFNSFVQRVKFLNRALVEEHVKGWVEYMEVEPYLLHFYFEKGDLQ